MEDQPDNHSVLYRYFFFDWMFKDMGVAKNLFEGAAFWRHNKSMKGHLWIYLRRWVAVSALSFGMGALFSDPVRVPVLAGIGYMGFSVALSIVMMIGATWAVLTAWD